LDNFIFIKRENYYRSEFGGIKATLNGINDILQEREFFDYILLISGQDYPIKSPAYICDYLEQNSDKTFISYTTMPVRGWGWGPTGGMEKLTHYFFRFRGNLRVYPPFNEPVTNKQRLLNFIFGLYFKTPRKFPDGLKPYAGAAWWTITRDAAQYLVDFLKIRPDVINFYKNSISMDELFFQTILCNSNDDKILSHLVNDDLRFINWSHKDQNLGHPEILTINHFDAIKNSPKLIARKFDPTIDNQILDMIDERILFT
jgi:hypothetical protein